MVCSVSACNNFTRVFHHIFNLFLVNLLCQFLKTLAGLWLSTTLANYHNNVRHMGGLFEISSLEEEKYRSSLGYPESRMFYPTRVQ